MSSIIDSVRSTLSSNPKHSDLKKDTHETSTTATMRTDFGVAISDPDNWLKLASADSSHGGPSLLEDNIAREKIHRFDHERIPEVRNLRAHSEHLH